ncbi:aldehyde dehydrogenase family protein [Trinickia terrae]|uniref:Aldehyde dehydrogenase family protein n=1 Tax=Trinickia terrae TaxID=2571161 RepID=A0A4U1I5R7_9BURK|nr:aldehyde dehydrogenase family protein [Trinickia terrae]TKC88688.1 aldehyde dehydrogenase family protein [Trinickia terrae]
MESQSNATVAVSDEVASFAAREHGLFIDGGWRASQSSARLDVFNPATGRRLAQVADANAADIDAAVTSAACAFASGVWRKLRPADRERILLKLADALEAHGETFAQLETLNQGKSINIARAVEVGATVEYMRYMAGWATKITGETMDVSIPFPPGTRYTAYTRREPVGVVAGIVPWNFPLMIAVWKLIPALASGCSIVIKPSPETPLTALLLAQIACEAGVPPGVFNVVTGGAEAGDALVKHPLVNKISFTGSTRTGKLVGTAAVQNMTRFSLELGGKNPIVMLADVDVEQVVQGVMAGAFFNQGQVCAAASRLYVHRSRFQQVTEALAAAADSMTLGPGLDPAAQINPLVSAKHRDSVARYIERGRAEGATLLCGGGTPELDGFYVKPTVMTGVGQDAAVVREEIFGPVLAAVPFDDTNEAIRMANDTPYGLTASLWTNDLKAALNLIPEIEAGTVWVNCHIPLDPSLPFGGFKQSGIGREFGRQAIDGFTEVKSVCIAH